MSFLVELDEGTAARRRIPFRVFTSDGTSPETGLSDGTMLLSKNGGARAVSSNSISAISTNAGMYYIELTAAECDTLGSVELFTDDQGPDFEQHVANVQIVNFNPMSTQSNDLSLRPTTAGRTLDVTATGAAGVDWANVEGQSTEVDLSLTTIRGIDLNNDKTGYNVSSLDANTITNTVIANDAIGATEIVDGAIDAATFAAGAIDAAAIAADAITSSEIADNAITAAKIASDAITAAKVADGTIDAATFAAGAIDAAAIAANAIGASELAADAVSEIAAASADSVWDEDRTDHIGQDSFGGIFQASQVSRLQIAGTTTEVRLGSGETTRDDHFNKRGIALQYTSGDWITNVISDYTGSNKSARLIFDLPLAPESGSTYILLPEFESLMTVAGALQPTTAGRTLDVTATGAAGVDWGNVENQATEVDLSLTTIRGIDLVSSTLDVNTTQIEGADATDQINAACDTALTDYGALTPTVAGRTLDITAGGTAGIDWANIEGQATEVDLSLTTIRGADLLGTNLDKTGYALSAAGELSAASSLLSLNMGQNRYVQDALFALRNRVFISGSTMTVYHPDDSTSAWTASVTTGTDTITQVDPGGL